MIHGRTLVVALAIFAAPAAAHADEAGIGSLTAYDRQTHALIRDMPRASRSSQIQELQKNADGSVDVFVGPKASEGMDTNWIPTDAKRDFELMFRLYAPTKALFEWALPDIEKATAQ